MKKIAFFTVALLCSISLYAKGDLLIFEVNNAEEKVTPLSIEEAFTNNGFSLGVNSEMNLPFKKQFEKTTFKIFTLLTVYHTKLSIDLLKRRAEAGVFTPMGVGIYQGLDEDVLRVSILTSEAQAKIAGFEDENLGLIQTQVVKVLKRLLPNAKSFYSQDSLEENRSLLTQYELDLDGDDWEEAKEELEMNLESGFEPFGFVMPGFIDLNEEMTQESKIQSPYDFYSTYSICKLKVIYTVALSRPEAAAFAPCTVMVYKKKDEDKIVLGFPSVYNWMSGARIQDLASKEVLMKAQKDFESVLKDVTE